MIIEWAEKIADVLPDEHMNIKMDILSDRKRRLEFTAAGNKYVKLLKGLSR